MSTTVSLVRVGLVIKPHGVQGEVAVEATGPTLSELDPGVSVWVGIPPQERRLEGIRPHAGRELLHLSGVTDRDAAEELRGAPVAVPSENLSAPAEGEAYVDDLVGCAVESADGAELGTVRNVIPAGARNLLLVDGPAGEVFIPMVRDWLVELDTSEGRIVMDLPPGLLEQDA